MKLKVKEVKDREKLYEYLHTYQMESKFNEPLLPHLTLFSFESGELICSQGEASETLYVLVQGKVKIYTTSTEGKTLILSFKTPLEVIGDIEYVRNTDFLNTVEAVSPVYMIGISHHWLRKHGSDHAPLLKFLLEIITQKFHMKSTSMSFNLMYPVEVRLASYLLSVSFEECNHHDTTQIRTAGLIDAANLIGTSYRHLNRVLQRFCEEGWIERHKGFILVKDREGLHTLAGHSIYE